MPIIDNKNLTMQLALAKALENADRIDISVAFFYFNGFELLAKELKDKKIRLLIGMEIDPNFIPEIVKASKDGAVDVSLYQVRPATKSALKIRENYIRAIIGLINDSDIFDESTIVDSLDLFMEKIKDGSLEIRKRQSVDHSKYYIAHNKENDLLRSKSGTVIMGSANFTFKGLVGQGETNEQFESLEKYFEYTDKFEKEWYEAIPIVDEYNNDDFIEEVKNKTWPYKMATPFEMYIRVLDEIFGKHLEEDILTPSQITSKQYVDLEYQLDAIKMGIDRIKRYDGVIIADVVGLGKSVIASAIARNFDDYLTVIIAPPHLLGQWEDYKVEFSLRAAKVYSSGNIKVLYEQFKVSSKPLLLIIDEAHRFRNEETDDYKYLHQVTRSHAENKTILLTATPFNNAPKDIFSLIKLFQIPGRSTIRAVDNLSFRFRNLIDRYIKLRRDIRKNNIDSSEIQQETIAIAREQRRLIENVVIRRSRLDLKNITRYREDLKKQKIDFSEVVGPKLIDYNLGELNDLYLETLTKLVDGYSAARYQPTKYGIDSEEFKKRFGEDMDERGLIIGQLNLANHMKRLLVMRFESSKFAFQNTLKKIITTNQIIEKWWNEFDGIPIMKKGELPDPDDYTEEDGEISADFDAEIDKLKKNKGLIVIPKDMFKFKDEFERDLRSDTKLLGEIYDKWFETDEYNEVDPKLDAIDLEIKKLIRDNPNRKIVIFSSYADTVNYLYDKLKKNPRIIKYTSADPNVLRKTIKSNFDAAVLPEKQEDDFDVIITTDALSEGVNLHRAGVIINYDIPYNPTRVIQRVGRTNRINKKIFDKIYVYNFFPTMIGEAETKLKQIATLKIALINAIIGSDTRHLTPDENLESFFKGQFDQIANEEDQLSWDTIHLEAYERAKKNEELISNVRSIPRRSRIRRVNTSYVGTIAFGKKGSDSVFAISSGIEKAKVISVEEAIPYFMSSADENAHEVSQEFNDLMNIVKNRLFAKNNVPQIKGRRQKAIVILNAVKSVKPQFANYCSDLIKIIREFDDISEGTLKDIIEIDLNKIDIFKDKLESIVSEKLVQNILERAERAEDSKEMLLLLEEHTHES
jgi:superfamily II DNA or RNA helicase/HKD family nuclease